MRECAKHLAGRVCYGTLAKRGNSKIVGWALPTIFNLIAPLTAQESTQQNSPNPHGFAASPSAHESSQSSEESAWQKCHSPRVKSHRLRVGVQ